MITVNCWLPSGGNVGHASAGFSDGGYVSWWPQDSNRWKENRPGANNTQEDDIRAEGKPPDLSRQIRGLNERAAIIWWNNFLSTGTSGYQATTQNCAWAVIQALKAAGADEHIHWTSLFLKFNIPNHVSIVPPPMTVPLFGISVTRAIHGLMDGDVRQFVGFIDRSTNIWTPQDCIDYADATIAGLRRTQRINSRTKFDLMA